MRGYLTAYDLKTEAEYGADTASGRIRKFCSIPHKPLMPQRSRRWVRIQA